MRAMKDTGVEWLNEIPEGWINVKFKYLFSESNSGEVIDKGYWDDGCELLYSCSKEPLFSNFSEFPQKKRTSIGDILLTRNATPYIFIPKPNSIYTNVVQRVKMKSTVYLPFIVYSLKSGSEFLNSFGDIIPSFNMEIWKNTFCPIPELAEQHRIAAYLDQKVAYIDNIIEKTMESIEEYKKLKQSVIIEAVTKGLNPDVKMKDSGIEWIGEIPEHWDCKKLKYAMSVSRGLFNHRPRNDKRFYDGNYPFIQTGDVARAVKYITTYSQTLNELGVSVSKKFPKGTLVMTIAANIGDIAVLDFDAYFPDSVIGLVPNQGYYWNYLYYILVAMNENFKETAITNTQANLNLERVRALKCAFTSSIEEQLEIAAFLDKKTQDVQNLIEKKTVIIAELESYKKSLIYEVVTGKKEPA